MRRVPEPRTCFWTWKNINSVIEHGFRWVCCAAAMIGLGGCGVAIVSGDEDDKCPTTRCADLGRNCGEISVEGCGVIRCGDCEAPETCGGGGTPNVCGTADCNSSWECEQPLNGNQKDGCGNRRLNPACDPIDPPEGAYYVATNGNDANPGTEAQPWLTIQNAANTAVAGDTVYVKAGTYVEQVTFPNSGTPESYITFQNYSSDIVTVKAPLKAYFGDPHKGNFQVFGTGYIKIKGFQFTTVGGAARTDSCDGKKCSPDGQISIEQGGHDVIIDGNLFYDIDSSAVIAGYTKVAGNNYAAWDITFINNYVYRPTDWNWVELMSYDSVNRPNISFNTFAYQGFGECLDYKSGTDNGIMSYNRVDNCWHPTRGPGGTPAKWGAIYIDAYDEGVNNNKVFGNIVSNSGGLAIGSEQGGLAQNNIFYNNIVFDSDLGMGTGYCCSPYTPNQQGNLFMNNVTYNIAGMAYFGEKGTDNIFRNNIAFGSGSINMKPQNIQDHNSWNLGINDPRFVDAAAHNFHLQSTSPAIDAGDSTGAPNTDFDGNPRPIGAGFDLGAYEYCAGASCTTTCTPNWQCETPLNGSEYDGCGNRRTKPACSWANKRE